MVADEVGVEPRENGASLVVEEESTEDSFKPPCSEGEGEQVNGMKMEDLRMQ